MDMRRSSSSELRSKGGGSGPLGIVGKSISGSLRRNKHADRNNNNNNNNSTLPRSAKLNSSAKEKSKFCYTITLFYKI